MVIPQFQQTPVEDEYRPTYENTLPGITNIATPMAKSTPVTQASQTPVILNAPLPERDMVEPVSSERVRTAYLERQIQDMSSVRLPLNIPSMEEESHAPTDLLARIQAFCKEQKEKRKQEWESLNVAVDKMKESKGKHPKQPDEEREVAYSQMAQNMERTRKVVRNSISSASTISAEEQQMALTEKEFSVIKKKIDKIDQRLDNLCKSWHAEYGSTTTLEECEEIKRFYKPYLEKYESKYRVLYHLLQQPSLISTHESISGMTPSLAALDDAPSLKQREWIRGEPGEDVPPQYSSIGGCLTPTTPRCEDMRLEPSLNITPKGSLADIPAAVDRERKNQVPEEGLLGTSSETMYMEIPDTSVKTVHESSMREAPRIIQRTKEASREEVIASTQQFFAAVDKRNASVTTGNPIASVEVRERDVTEVPDVPTTITTTVTTPPVALDMEPRGTSSPRISLPEGSPSQPTVTTTCRPRTWMQQITEGQINEPRREDASSSESNTSTIETLPEEIPEELGHEWRLLHPFELPGVRFPMDSTAPNQRRLAENDALVELIQTTEYLDDVPTWGQRDYRLYPPQYGDPFYRGRGRGR